MTFLFDAGSLPSPHPLPRGISFFRGWPRGLAQVTLFPASCPLGLAPWKSRTTRQSLRSCPSAARGNSALRSRRSASCTASNTTLRGVVGGGNGAARFCVCGVFVRECYHCCGGVAFEAVVVVMLNRYTFGCAHIPPEPHPGVRGEGRCSLS